MDVQGKEYFWRGPIQTRAHASKLISVAGWTFVVLGALFALPFFLRGAASPGELFGGVVLLLLMAVPGAFLLSRKSRAAAVLMLIAPIFSAIMFLVLPFVLLSSGAGVVEAIVPLVFLGFWSILALLAWRGFKAAGALRRLAAEARAAASVAESFA